VKILLTGGGTGGHFYPLIAIAEEIHRITDEEQLVQAELYYMSDTPYNKKLLFDNDIEFRKIFAGKARLYFSLWNIIDVFKLGLGILKALWNVYLLYPDVVVSKGGYASIPAVCAAWILRIPLIIHESDSIPGRSNIWAAKFATRIAVSWEEATGYFPKEKVALTGQPVRRDILHSVSRGAHEYLKLEETIPVILVICGSQGAQKINEVILDALPILVPKYQIIHQTGRKNIKEVSRIAQVILSKNQYKARYHPFGFLNTLALRMAAGATSIVVSRAGSSIFEIASWGKASIMVPITNSHGNHQRKNAFNYARKGATVVIGESNFSAHVLDAEITRIMKDENLRTSMEKSATGFFMKGAAGKIAQEAIRIALEHEK